MESVSSPARMRILVFFAVFGSGAALVACNDNTTSQSPCTPVSAKAVLARSIPSHIASHIPAIVRSFADRGKVDDEKLIPVTVALSLNNEDELDQRLAEIYRPGSAQYHQFISPEEFRARYAPTETQIADAQSYLESRGVHSAQVNANGFLISAFGTARALGSAFGAEIHRYRGASGASYFAPASEPVMPSGLSIRAVHGLHNVTHIRKHLHAARVTSSYGPLSSGRASFWSGAGPGVGMTPAAIRSVYNVPSSVHGEGQTLALVELDGYNPSDITAYESAFGLPNVPLQNIMVDGASGKAASGADEVTLDIELMTALAPGASKIQVYEGPNTSQGLLDIYSKIANDNTAKEISTSWGMPENETSTSFLETENTIFKQMAVQGQSFYAASGDAGAYDNEASLTVDDPGSQPFVVSVGGTTLSESGGSYVRESTWNNGSPSAGAGGGGVSGAWTQPSWQNGLASAANKGSGSMRNVPDVSLNADPNTGYSIYLNGQWVVFGGTSCAAPLWAAFTALVNQQRVANGLGMLGFPDPYLYSIGKGSRYSTDFHDVSDGSTNLYYPSTSGYDDATGWGSFNGDGLFQDLSTEPSITESDLSC